MDDKREPIVKTSRGLLLREILIQRLGAERALKAVLNRMDKQEEWNLLTDLVQDDFSEDLGAQDPAGPKDLLYRTLEKQDRLQAELDQEVLQMIFDNGAERVLERVLLAMSADEKRQVLNYIHGLERMGVYRE